MRSAARRASRLGPPQRRQRDPRRAAGATPRALADQDHALEAGFLDGAPEALRVGVQVRRAGAASDGGDIGRGERVAPGRPEERVAVMDEDPDVSQESVLGIGGVPHELGDPRPVGLGADARDLHAAAAPSSPVERGESLPEQGRRHTFPRFPLIDDGFSRRAHQRGQLRLTQPACAT